MNTSELMIRLASKTIRCPIADIGSTFEWLLREMQSSARYLRPEERDLLRKIMSAESRTYTVGDLFPEFTRECEAHKTLRRLRAGQFIHPGKHGKWDLGEPIEIKPFARLIWTQAGEEAIFPPGPSRPKPSPVEESYVWQDENAPAELLDLDDVTEKRK
jgi:hypothetical protein